MATYYITRKEHPRITNDLIQWRWQAFNVLYGQANKNAPRPKMFVRGTWMQAKKHRDGIFCDGMHKAEIVDLGRKYATLKVDDTEIKVDLCEPGAGFEEIMFITDVP